jgi:hypothetical protein
LTALRGVLDSMFSRRILAFDHEAAKALPLLLEFWEMNPGAGVLTGPHGPELQIAAIALVHDCYVATEHAEPFRAAGVKVINPWDL